MDKERRLKARLEEQNKQRRMAGQHKSQLIMQKVDEAYRKMEEW